LIKDIIFAQVDRDGVAITQPEIALFDIEEDFDSVENALDTVDNSNAKECT
jgi:hypothetical protein